MVSFFFVAFFAVRRHIWAQKLIKMQSWTWWAFCIQDPSVPFRAARKADRLKTTRDQSMAPFLDIRYKATIMVSQ